MSQLKDRLTQFVNSTDAKSITDFERICGLSIGTIAKCKESVTSETLAKIARKYPSVDLCWVIGVRDEYRISVADSPVPEEKDSGFVGSTQLVLHMMKQNEYLLEQAKQKDAMIKDLQEQISLLKK